MSGTAEAIGKGSGGVVGGEAVVGEILINSVVLRSRVVELVVVAPCCGVIN